MNLEKLKACEEYFLEIYPKGFNDDELLKIAKKHNIEKMSDLTKDLLDLM